MAIGMNIGETRYAGTIKELMEEAEMQEEVIPESFTWHIFISVLLNISTYFSTATLYADLTCSNITLEVRMSESPETFPVISTPSLGEAGEFGPLLAPVYAIGQFLSWFSQFPTPRSQMLAKWINRCDLPMVHVSDLASEIMPIYQEYFNRDHDLPEWMIDYFKNYKEEEVQVPSHEVNLWSLSSLPYGPGGDRPNYDDPWPESRGTSELGPSDVSHKVKEKSLSPVITGFRVSQDSKSYRKSRIDSPEVGFPSNTKPEDIESESNDKYTKRIEDYLGLYHNLEYINLIRRLCNDSADKINVDNIGQNIEDSESREDRKYCTREGYRAFFAHPYLAKLVFFSLELSEDCKRQKLPENHLTGQELENHPATRANRMLIACDSRLANYMKENLDLKHLAKGYGQQDATEEGLVAMQTVMFQYLIGGQKRRWPGVERWDERGGFLDGNPDANLIKSLKSCHAVLTQMQKGTLPKPKRTQSIWARPPPDHESEGTKERKRFHEKYDKEITRVRERHPERFRDQVSYQDYHPGAWVAGSTQFAKWKVPGEGSKGVVPGREWIPREGDGEIIPK